MPYQSPADFCAEYTKTHSHDRTVEFGAETTLDEVTVVSESPETARVDVVWYTCGHAPDAGFYDVFERTVFILVKRSDGWHVQSEEVLPYE